MAHVIYYSDDLDGKCSAAIYLDWLLKTGKLDHTQLDTVTFVPSRPYKMPTNIVDGHPAIAVFGCQYTAIIGGAIKDSASELCWFCGEPLYSLLEAEMTGVPGSFGYYAEGNQTCEAVWKHFYPNKDIPDFVKMIASHYATPGTKLRAEQFCCGLSMHDTAPRSVLWQDLLNEHELGVILYAAQTGEVALNYKKKTTQKVHEDFGYTGTFLGHLTYAVNYPIDSFDINEMKGLPYQLFLSYVFDGIGFNCVLYSATVDVQKLTEPYGGFGTPTRAAFYLYQAPEIRRAVS